MFYYLSSVDTFITVYQFDITLIYYLKPEIETSIPFLYIQDDSRYQTEF